MEVTSTTTKAIKTDTFGEKDQSIVVWLFDILIPAICRRTTAYSATSICFKEETDAWFSRPVSGI